MVRLSSLLVYFVMGLLPFALFAATPIKLTYLPATPVLQTSELSIEIDESMPILHLASKAKQVLKMEVTAAAQPGATRLTQPPIDLTVVLKDVFVDLFVNQEEAAFDPRVERSPTSLKEISKLIDKPIHLKVNEQNAIIIAPNDLQTLKRELPALNDIGIELLFGELLQHHFALLGKELTIGAKFQEPFARDSASPLPETIDYEIVSITDKDVIASIKGNIKPKEFQLKSPIKFDDKEEPILLSYSGSLKGEGTWNRQNAMLFQMKTDYTYLALLKAGPMQWKMQVILHHKLSSNKSP